MKKYVIKEIERPNQNIINKYKELDVSTVYEAQGKQGLMNYGLKPLIKGKMICGPAVTAVCYAGDNLMIHAAIEVCKPGDVLIITTIGESVAGMIGELIVNALMKREAQGIIIDAGVRDAAEIRVAGFPVWYKAIHSEGTNKIRGGWVNAPTVCSGTLVNPGDLVMADDDGVVIIKKEDIQTSLKSSLQRAEKEKETKRKIASGQLSLDFYDLRTTLQNENVVYFENEADFQKNHN